MVNTHIELRMSYDCTITRQDESIATALQALAWIIGDETQRQRFLALTGVDATTLRAQANTVPLLAATLAYLAAHEPSLQACAQALDMSPAALIEANSWLKRHDTPPADL